MRTPKQDSQAAVDKSSSEQGSGILSTRGTVDNRQHELEQLVVKMLYPSKEGGTTVSMTRVREATAVINAHTQKLLAEELTEIVAKNTDTMLGTTDADGVFEDVCDRIATLTNQPSRNKG